jgi:hypothetical protein
MTLTFKSTIDFGPVKKNAREGAIDGLKEASDHLLALSQTLVPVSPWSQGGFLKETGKAEVDEAELQAAVSYSGSTELPSLPVWVHERMGLQHETGQSKFLETPMNASKDEIAKIIAQHIKSKLGA